MKALATLSATMSERRAFEELAPAQLHQQPPRPFRQSRRQLLVGHRRSLPEIAGQGKGAKDISAESSRRKPGSTNAHVSGHPPGLVFLGSGFRRNDSNGLIR